MGNPSRVLVVDDNALNLKIISDVLKEDYSVITAKSGPEALGILAAAPPLPQLILLDVVMPDMNGFEVCKIIKSTHEWGEIPIIFLTALSNEDDEAYGLELGAVDYITIPFNPALMKARVRNHIRLKLYYDRLMQNSLVDGLTGIPNRKRFDETLAQEWKRSFRCGEPLSLIIADIDHFKEYNDRYGHVRGDECLRQIGSVLACSINPSVDLAARYGGEEFACILPDTDIQAAVAIAEKIRQGIQDL